MYDPFRELEQTASRWRRVVYVVALAATIILIMAV